MVAFTDGRDVVNYEWGGQLKLDPHYWTQLEMYTFFGTRVLERIYYDGNFDPFAWDDDTDLEYR